MIRTGFVLACGLLAAAPLQAQFGTPPRADRFETVPAAPVAGQAFDVVLVLPVLMGGPTYVPPEPTTSVTGNLITIALNSSCVSISCDVLVPTVAKAGVPALPAGRYDVRVVRNANTDEAPLRTHTLQVGSGAAAPRVVPGTGFWLAPAYPSSGLTLQQRDDTIAMAIFTYSPGQRQGRADWMLGAGQLRGDRVAMVMDRFDGGNCLGCSGANAVAQAEARELAILEFAEPRQGTIRVNDAAAVPILHYDAGATLPSLDAPATNRLSLDLPDFQGRWIFVVGESSRPVDAIFRAAERSPGLLSFRNSRIQQANSEGYRIDCTTPASGAALCKLYAEQSDGENVIAARVIGEFDSGSAFDDHVIGVVRAANGSVEGQLRGIRAPLQRIR